MLSAVPKLPSASVVTHESPEDLLGKEVERETTDMAEAYSGVIARCGPRQAMSSFHFNPCQKNAGGTKCQMGWTFSCTNLINIVSRSSVGFRNDPPFSASVGFG